MKRVWMLVACLGAVSCAAGGGDDIVEDRGDVGTAQDWSQAADVQSACREVFDLDDDTANCLAMVADARFQPTGVIYACAQSYSQDGDALQCLADTIGAYYNVARDILACSEELSNPLDVTRCYKMMADAEFYASGLPAACGKYTVQVEDFFGCLDRALVAEMTPAALTECDDITVSAAEFLACLDD